MGANPRSREILAFEQRFDVITFCRYSVCMSTATRATVYFDQDMHKALRLKAAVMGCSISEIVNTAVSQCLAEDVEDIEAYESRRREPGLDFETVIKALRRRGKI